MVIDHLWLSGYTSYYENEIIIGFDTYAGFVVNDSG
jgi:hypothetical protein